MFAGVVVYQYFFKKIGNIMAMNVNNDIINPNQPTIKHQLTPPIPVIFPLAPFMMRLAFNPKTI